MLMKRIIVICTFNFFWLYNILFTVAYGEAANPSLQEQLQRLQAAVQQSNQPISAPVNPSQNATPVQQPGMMAPITAGVPTPRQPPPTPQLQIPPATAAALAAPSPPPPPVGAVQAAAPRQEANQAMMIGLNMRDQAFTDAADNLLPLSPDQIRTLHALFSRTQRAVGEHPGIPPRPSSTSKIVNLAPGATPPIIRLSAGFVTSLVFLDASGAPWPIAAYDLGDPRSYNIQWDKKSNMLMLQAVTEYKTGNLAVMLRDLNTPIMVTLLPGQRAVDYRVDLRIPGLGPDAVPSVAASSSMELALPSASNPILLEVLNGVPPQGAKALQVVGRDCQVWLVGSKMYVRTRLTVLSPGWIATLSSADGMHAYEMQQTPVILASENGKMVKLIIQGL
jgi:intracellular multiplication protein IcmK